MSGVDELIKEKCPGGAEYRKIKDVLFVLEELQLQPAK